MKSSIGLCFKFLIITIVGITIPKLVLLATALIEAFWFFWSIYGLGITILIYLIYHIVFSVILGTKSYRYLKKNYVAIIVFIVLNSFLFLCLNYVIDICIIKLSLDTIGAAVILLIDFSQTIISIFVFSITSIITKLYLKKKTFIGSQTENDSI